MREPRRPAPTPPGQAGSGAGPNASEPGARGSLPARGPRRPAPTPPGQAGSGAGPSTAELGAPRGSRGALPQLGWDRARPNRAPRPNPARPGGVRGGREPACTGVEAPRPNPARPGGVRGGTERGRTAGTTGNDSWEHWNNCEGGAGHGFHHVHCIAAVKVPGQTGGGR